MLLTSRLTVLVSDISCVHMPYSVLLNMINIDKILNIVEQRLNNNVDSTMSSTNNHMQRFDNKIPIMMIIILIFIIISIIIM